MGSEQVARERIRELEAANTALRRSHQLLAAEVRHAQLLQQIATQFIAVPRAEALYEQILDATQELLRADFARIQIFCPERGTSGELRLLRHRGFGTEAAKLLEWVNSSTRTTCGEALRTRRRIVVPDVRKCDFMAGSEDLRGFLAEGICAAQSLPLISRSAELLGMVSTYWREPHELSATESRSLEVLAWMVAGLIEHSRVEEARRESQKHLASIYDTVKDVIFHLAVEPEKQFRFVSANAAFLRVTGTSAQSVVGKTVNEVIPEPSRTMVVGKYEQAIKERTTVSWEETSDYPVGRLTGEVSVAPVFDDQGTCTHLVGSVHDITEFKRIEAGLRESEERLKRAECLAHLGHLDLNLKTGRIEWSEQVLRILGCPDGFNAGLTGFYEIVSPPDRERVKQWVRDCLATKKGGPIELRVMRPGGDLRTLSVTSEIFLDQDGRLARLFGSCHDVTEMKAFEVQILQNQRDLRALTARLVDIQESGMKELACELHDELSQDLALLGMGMSALRSPSDALHPSFPERLRALEAQAWKLANDVYSMAMRLHPVILHDLGLEAALREECRGFEERTGIPVQFTSEGQKVELGQDVLLCFFRVAQEGFHNIARHAGATNVRLTLSGGNGNCTLRIDDNGRGFDPTATEGRSSLGLVSMRERMRLVNGSFTIQSHPGEGTTLEFSAPSAVGQWQT